MIEIRDGVDPAVVADMVRGSTRPEERQLRPEDLRFLLHLLETRPVRGATLYEDGNPVAVGMLIAYTPLSWFGVLVANADLGLHGKRVARAVKRAMRQIQKEGGRVQTVVARDLAADHRFAEFLGMKPVASSSLLRQPYLT